MSAPPAPVSRSRSRGGAVGKADGGKYGAKSKFKGYDSGIRPGLIGFLDVTAVGGWNYGGGKGIGKAHGKSYDSGTVMAVDGSYGGKGKGVGKSYDSGTVTAGGSDSSGGKGQAGGGKCGSKGMLRRPPMAGESIDRVDRSDVSLFESTACYGGKGKFKGDTVTAVGKDRGKSYDSGTFSAVDLSYEGIDSSGDMGQAGGGKCGSKGMLRRPPIGGVDRSNPNLFDILNRVRTMQTDVHHLRNQMNTMKGLTDELLVQFEECKLDISALSTFMLPQP